MDNYYGDKYNLDDYYLGEKRERRTNKSPRKNRKNQRVKKTNSYGKKPQSRDGNTNNVKNNTSSKVKKPAKNRTFYVLISFLAVAFCVVMGIVIFGNYDTTFTFSKDVSISGIDISGLTYKQAKEVVESKAETVVEKFNIKVSAKEFSESFTQKDFTYKFDIKKALDEARIYSLKEQGKYEGSTQAKFKELENPDFKLTYSVDEKSIVHNVASFAETVDREYVNARVKEFKPFSSQRFVYQQAQDGYQLVQDDLSEKLNQFFESKKRTTNIEALVNVYEPNITVSDLENNIVGLSKATSVSYNTENGNTNMKVALEACNGSVIEPGELWSFNKCTGDSNLEKNGYKPATVISGQKLAEGIGGGLCQASTTIFRAAIFANMSICERHNHFWASSYAYPGEDATIDYPNLDLKLRNPTEYQMFMECKMEGTTLTVNIYGYQDPSYDNIKVYSRNHDIQKRKSYKTTTHRVLYLKGKIIKEEILCNSTYSLKDGAKVKSPDKGTFRTMVNGTVQYETEPPTETTQEKTEETKKPESAKPTEPTKRETEPSQTTPTEKETDKITEQVTESTTALQSSESEE